MQPAESTPVVAFRAFVMLACLVLVPLAAVFGSQCPEIVKSLLIDKVSAWIRPNGAETKLADAERRTDRAAKSPESETRSGVAKALGSGDAQARGPSATPARRAARGDGVASATGETTSGANRRSAPAQLAAHASRTTADWQTDSDHDWNASDNEAIDVNQRAVHLDSSAANAATISTGRATQARGQEPTGALERDSIGRSAARSARSESAAATGRMPTASGVEASSRGAANRSQTAGAADPFAAIERKLRDYGASYYLLEAWGADHEMYRFHCKMPLGDAARESQNFEAFDRDAIRAMTQVLEQIEHWQSRGNRG